MRNAKKRLNIVRYDRESDVLYPPIDDCFFEVRHPVAMEHPDYYLIVSTLVPYKRIELAIEVCN